MNYLLTALMTKISGSALSSDVGGRIYLDQAPDGCEFPYIVFFIVSGVPEKTFTEDFENILIQFSIFSASPGATEITTIYNHLDELFDECSFTITNNLLLRMNRENLTTMVEDITVANAITTVKGWHIDYSILIEKN